MLLTPLPRVQLGKAAAFAMAKPLPRPPRICYAPAPCREETPMAVSHVAPPVAPRTLPPIRHIHAGDLRAALPDGWRDFLQMRGDLLFIGLLYPIIGLLAAVVSLGGSLIPLFFPIAA